jgi:hypothetical protein
VRCSASARRQGAAIRTAIQTVSEDITLIQDVERQGVPNVREV